MYELDETTDLSFLVSKELIQVCIGSYQTILQLADDVTITIESSCDLVDPDGCISVLFADQSGEMAKLTILLNGVVTAWQVEGNGSIQLKFSNGCVLVIKNSNKHTESYSICARDKDIVV